MSRSLDHLLNGATATLREAVLPQLTDSNARANLFAVLQVLDLLVLQVDWAEAPLQAQLNVRRQALAEMPSAAATLCSAQVDGGGALLDAIDALDVRVVELVDRLANTLDIEPTQRGEIERWTLAYGMAANAEELRRIPRSRIGQLTSTT